MHKVFFKLGSFLAMVAVIIGAFGAHLLKGLLSVQELESIQTAVTYQMTHALALFLTGVVYKIYHKASIKYAGYFFLSGVILFSGSIYLRILLKYFDFPKANMVAIITPFGGASFILGWLIMMFAISLSKRSYRQPTE